MVKLLINRVNKDRYLSPEPDATERIKAQDVLRPIHRRKLQLEPPSNVRKASTVSSLIFFSSNICNEALQKIHSLPIKIIDGLNSVGNYRRNIDGTKHIIFSTFLLPFTDRIPTNF